MRPHRPRLGVITSVRRAPPSSFTPVENPHDVHARTRTSVFRNAHMEIHVHSPSVKFLRSRDFELGRPLPVFGNHDKVEGTVVLDMGLCSTPGRLTISMEGAFICLSPHLNHSMDSSISSSHRHVLYLTSIVIPVGRLETQRSVSSLRDALAATVRPKGRERRGSLVEKGPPKPFPFSFEIPRSTRSGEEMPPTFSSITLNEAGPRARASVERTEISYKITATWEPYADIDNFVSLEVPILFHPDHDFQSLDGTALEPTSWFEIPLSSERQIPFTCAVTLPDPAIFARSAFLPYFVVFTTSPRSMALAREITVDATIAVSLVREIKIDSVPVPEPLSPSSAGSSATSDSFEIPSPVTPQRLFRRMVNSAPPVLMRAAHTTKRPRLQEKALPQLPTEGMLETRTLYTDVCVGFPKRPRTRIEPNQHHPSLESHTSLPDGLYKGKIQLDKQMLPSIAWAGLSVKYFVEVSVVFGQDEQRARVPIRLF